LDPATADDMSILSRSGGERATDSFLLMAEPTQLDVDRYQIEFWASDVSRVQGLAWEHLCKLEAGVQLTLTSDSQLQHENFAMGRVPHFVTALLPSSDPEVWLVRRNKRSVRHMLLCRLIFHTKEDLMARFAGMSKNPEDRAIVDQRLSAPKFMVGQAVPSALALLIDRLAEGNLPERPVFPTPTDVTLWGKSIRDPGIKLTWDRDGHSLLLASSDLRTGMDLLTENPNRSDDAYMELSDESTVHSPKTGTYSRGNGWSCQLRSWHWQAVTTRTQPVRYWVGLLPSADLDPEWLNLSVTTLSSTGLRGMHIDEAPTWTLLKLNPLDEATHGYKLAFIIQASDLDHDPGRNLWAATNSMAMVAGITEPLIFYGYDDSLRVCAAYARGQNASAISEHWLPIRPLANSVDKHRREPIWPVPFLRCLRRAILNKASASAASTLDSIVYFRWVLEEKYLPAQIAKLGIALRTLLRAASGAALEAADWLDPEKVNEELTRLASQHRLRLPDGATYVLELSHRLALFGDRGIGQLNMEVRDFYELGDWECQTEALRTTFAIILASAICYYGPVVGRLHSIRSYSAPHDPWLQLGAGEQAQQAEQASQARASYVVGELESLPVW